TSPTFAAANGVDFLFPVKPNEPADAHMTVPPDWSAKETRVLLKVDSINKSARSIFILPILERARSRFPLSTPEPCFLSMRRFPMVYVFSSLRLPEPMVFLTFPRTVREFVFVRCPRVGRPFWWRSPR